MSSGFKCAAGVSTTDAGADSFAEAAARAALGLGGAPADVAVVFAGAPNLAHAAEGMAAVVERLHPAAAIGCGAQGVVGEAREVEVGGVAVWAAALGGGAADAFALETSETGGGSLAITGMPDLDRSDALVLLVDPFSFPVEPLLTTIADGHPGLPVVGGLASARDDRGTLFGPDGPVPAGAVGRARRRVRVAGRAADWPRDGDHGGRGKRDPGARRQARRRAHPGGGDRPLAGGARARGARAAARPGRRPEQARLRARRLPG